MPGQTKIVTRSRDGESVIYPTGNALTLNTDSLLAAWTFAAQSGNTVHNDARADFDGQRENDPQWRWDRTAGPALRGGGSQYVQLSNHDDYTGGVTFAGLINPHTSQTALIGARQEPYLSFGIRAGTQVEVALGNTQTETSDSGLGLPQTNDWQLIGVRGNGSSGEWIHIYQGTTTTGSFSYSWPTSGNYGMRLLNAQSSGHYLDGDQGLTVLYERELPNEELINIYNMATGEW